MQFKCIGGKKKFPAFLKSPGAAAHTTGADSPLFCWSFCGGLRVGIGGVMRGLRLPDGGAFAVQRPLDSGWMNRALNVIVMHRDSSPFIALKMWRPLSSAEGRDEQRKKQPQLRPQTFRLPHRACGQTRRISLAEVWCVMQPRFECFLFFAAQRSNPSAAANQKIWWMDPDLWYRPGGCQRIQRILTLSVDLFLKLYLDKGCALFTHESLIFVYFLFTYWCEAGGFSTHIGLEWKGSFALM